MLTNQDITELKTIFVTKPDFKKFRDEIRLDLGELRGGKLVALNEKLVALNEKLVVLNEKLVASTIPKWMSWFVKQASFINLLRYKSALKLPRPHLTVKDD